MFKDKKGDKICKKNNTPAKNQVDLKNLKHFKVAEI